jgi:hypothetical protein
MLMGLEAFLLGLLLRLLLELSRSGIVGYPRAE